MDYVQTLLERKPCHIACASWLLSYVYRVKPGQEIRGEPEWDIIYYWMDIRIGNWFIRTPTG